MVKCSVGKKGGQGCLHIERLFIQSPLELCQRAGTRTSLARKTGEKEGRRGKKVDLPGRKGKLQTRSQKRTSVLEVL